MAGEHLLKLLNEPNSRLLISDKWLIRDDLLFTVYQHKPHKKYSRILIQTTDEQEACRIMKEN